MEYEEHVKRVYAPCLSAVKQVSDGEEPKLAFGKDHAGTKIAMFIGTCKDTTHICIAEAHADDYPKCTRMHDTRNMQAN